MHGTKWIGDDEPVELIYANPRRPKGVLTRRETEIIGGLTVTTAARTAFDLGRRGRLDTAIARLDALSQATSLSISDLAGIAERHKGIRGLRRLEAVMELVDAGAESPRETFLRLLLIRNGIPRPRTQIPVLAESGHPLAYLDMGWPELMVAVEYDGDHHRADRRQYVKDIRRYELLESLGWIIVRVVAEDHPVDVLRRVRQALELRRYEATSTS